MTERWVLAAATGLACAAALFTLRRRNPLEPTAIAVVTTLLIATFYPLSTAFVEPLTWRHVKHIDAETVLAVQADYLAFALGLLAAVAWSWTRGGRAPTAEPAGAPPDARARWRDGVLCWGLLAAGVGLYLLYVQRVGLAPLLDRQNFAEKYRVSGGLGPLMFGLNLVIASCLWAEASELPPAQRRFFRLVGLAVVAWAVLAIAVRSYAAWIALGYAFLWFRRRGLELRRVRLRLVLLLVVGFVAAEAYSMLRGAWHGDVVEALAVLEQTEVGSASTLGQVVGGSELSHPFITSLELAEHEEAGALLGASYAEAALTFVPLLLMPERPQTLAQRFVAEYYPAVDERGGGVGFSLVGEAWWNLGPLLGPLLLGLALGGLLRSVQEVARRRPHGLTARLVPYLLFLVLLMHRSAVSTSAKGVFQILLPVLCLAAGAQLAWLALARGPRREPRSTSVPTLVS